MIYHHYTNAFSGAVECSSTSRDWNSVDIIKLQQKDQGEITRFYTITKDFLLWFFRGNQEAHHDAFMKVLDSLPRFDPNKRKFHRFVYLIALREKRHLWRSQRKSACRLPEGMFEDFAPDACELFGQGWSIEQLEHLERLIERLTKDEQRFIETYQKNDAEPAQRRMKFARIKAKLVQLNGTK